MRAGDAGVRAQLQQGGAPFQLLRLLCRLASEGSEGGDAPNEE